MEKIEARRETVWVHISSIETITRSGPGFAVDGNLVSRKSSVAAGSCTPNRESQAPCELLTLTL